LKLEEASRSIVGVEVELVVEPGDVNPVRKPLSPVYMRSTWVETDSVLGGRRTNEDVQLSV
jgi:hypothetical protein